MRCPVERIHPAVDVVAARGGLPAGQLPGAFVCIPLQENGIAHRFRCGHFSRRCDHPDLKGLQIHQLHLSAVVFGAHHNLVGRFPNFCALWGPHELADSGTEIGEIGRVFHFGNRAADGIQVQVVSVGIRSIDQKRQETACHHTGIGDIGNLRRLIRAGFHGNLHVAYHFPHLDQHSVYVSPFLDAQGDVVDARYLRNIPHHIAIIGINGETVIGRTHFIRWHIIRNDVGVKPPARDEVICQQVPVGIVGAGVVNPRLEQAGVLLRRVQQLDRIVVPG